MKTVTMSEFRREPGEHLIDVRRGEEGLLLTKGGKPVARVLPISDITTITRDGKIHGEPPLTMRLRLDGSY